MKSVCMLSLLLVQATIHSAVSNELEDRFLSDKVCHEINNLEVKIRGEGVTCGGEVEYKVLSFDAESPIFQYPKADEDKLYSIFVVDADTPGCKTKLHYLIGNVPGKKLAEGHTTNQAVFSVYFPPELPHGSKTHRYFVYAFSQTIPADSPAIPSARCHFNLNKFIDDNSLKLVAANMFKTQNE